MSGSKRSSKKNKALRVMQSVADQQLTALAIEIGKAMLPEPDGFSDNRAKTLLVSGDALDEPTLNDFRRLMGTAKMMRVGVADLIDSADITVEGNTSMLKPTVEQTPDWLLIAMSAYAHKLEYDVTLLDPANPPSQHSPAGQVVHHTAAWVRRQVSRSALDREKLARSLAFKPSVVAAETTNQQAFEQPQRPPAQIPVRYFEYNDPIALDADDVNNPAPPVSLGQQLTIEEDELARTEDQIQILGEPRRVTPPSGVPVPPRRQQESRVTDAARSAGNYVRENVNRDSVAAATQRVVAGTGSVFNQIRESITADSSAQFSRARLIITVMDYPNGHGLAAVQTFVRYTGSRKEVAGATADDGEFIVSLPARGGVGVAYEVTIVWPDEFGGKKEKKRITVNLERSDYHLPFYSRLVP